MASRQLVIELVGEASKFTKTLGEAEKASKTFGDKIADTGKKMTAFATVPIVGFLAAGTKAAMDDAAAQEHLARTLENTVGNSKDLVAQVEAYIGKAQKVSTFTDDELRPAFETFATTTHSVEESQKLLAIAMDVAAGKNIDLETATKAVAKANEGQLAAANKLVPGLVDVKDETLGAEQAVALLAQTFNGQAQAATETTAGKMQNLKRDLGEASEAMGAKLLPAVASFATFATDTLIPVLDELSGGNGAFVLLGVAAAGPVLSNIMKLKAGIDAMNVSLGVTAGFVAPLAAVLATLKGIDIAKDRANREGTLSGIIGREPARRFEQLKDLLGFADGGRPPVGKMSIVGERGPELFVPDAAGTVVPNHMLGGSGGGTTVNVHVAGSVITQRDLGRVVADALRDNALIGVS